VLGLVLAFNLVASIATPNNGITFSVPWLQIAIIVVLAYIASLITTYVPAWQASRVFQPKHCATSRKNGLCYAHTAIAWSPFRQSPTRSKHR